MDNNVDDCNLVMHTRQAHDRGMEMSRKKVYNFDIYTRKKIALAGIITKIIKH